MRRKTASAIGLLAFALVAGLAAIRDLDLTSALYRAILAAVVMAVVGYVAGFIAEKAIDEAVNSREPLRPQPTASLPENNEAIQQEED